jgi:hypothetical protein
MTYLPHGLVTQRSQINDAQPPMGKNNPDVVPDSHIVRAPVRDGSRHLLDLNLQGDSVAHCAGDSAHRLVHQSPA